MATKGTLENARYQSWFNKLQSVDDNIASKQGKVMGHVLPNKKLLYFHRSPGSGPKVSMMARHVAEMAE
jgi:hypothetical protein